MDVSENYVRTETEWQLQEIERRRNSYCADRPPIEIAGRTAIVVDDGIATGATMRVGLRAVRRRDPAWLVLAVPPDMLDTFREAADEIVCLAMPPAFGVIRFYYRDFPQMSDAEVTDLLVRPPSGGRGE